MSTLPEDDAEACLQLLEETGVFDDLRAQLVARIKENPRLQEQTEKLVVESKHLPNPEHDKKTQSIAYEQIRKELTADVIEKMVAAIWEEMDKDGSSLKQNIDEECHAAICKVYSMREEQQTRLE